MKNHLTIVANSRFDTLSRDLKELEMNQLITRTVLNTQPVTVEYEITEYGSTLKRLTTTIAEWGMEHRKRIIGK